MITRRKDYSKQLPSKDARKMYLFCEGKGTEPDYFAFFKGLSSNLEIITLPPENGTDPIKLMELAEGKLLKEDSRYIMDYLAKDSVWFVIDTDTWEREGKIALLREFCMSANNAFLEKWTEVKPYSAWNVAQSNPCFEIWLYYHLYKDAPDPNIIATHPSFKAFVGSVISGGFNFQTDPVKVETAIDNAKANFKRDEEGKLVGFSTEVFGLAEEIIPFVRQHLERLKGKMM